MTQPPDAPKIYHITHVDNLPTIIGAGGLVSDAAIIARGGGEVSIGMADIKAYRLRKPVSCHAGTCVGDYVPFYLCSRSIMLYVISCRNNPGLAYSGGQEPIVHLEADMHNVVAWAEAHERRWAFSDMNARTGYAGFYCDLARLDEINWTAVRARQWAAAEIKEAKQAEFLLHEEFPWPLVSRIGVMNEAMKTRVETVLKGYEYKPAVEVQRPWYY